MSTFNPDTFLNTEVKGPMETKFTPVPENDDGYVASIESISARNPKDDVFILDVNWNIHDDDLKAKMGRDKILVRQSVFLDYEDGRLQFGENKNVQLGRLREAVGQNTGKPWSPHMLIGAGPARIKTKNRHVEETDDWYTDVKRVAPLS